MWGERNVRYIAISHFRHFFSRRVSRGLMKNSRANSKASSFPVSMMRQLLSSPAVHKFACFGKQVKPPGERKRAEKKTRLEGEEKKLGRQTGGFSRDEKASSRERNIGHPGTERWARRRNAEISRLKKSGQYFYGRRGAFKCMYSYALVSLWREVWSKLFKLTRTLFSPLGLGHFLAPLHPRTTSRSLSLSLPLSIYISFSSSRRPPSSSSFPPCVALSSHCPDAELEITPVLDLALDDLVAFVH